MHEWGEKAKKESLSALVGGQRGRREEE